MTPPARKITIAGSLLVIVAILIYAFFPASWPNGKLMVQQQKKDAGGYRHTVRVRQFAGRFNTELSDDGYKSRPLPVSSYEFYEGSSPISAATIEWPDLQHFVVSFNNGTRLDCSWTSTNCLWTIH